MSQQEAKMRTLSKLLLCFLSIGVCNVAIAQGYPNRPVKIVVPFATGGPTDLLARLYANELTGQLGKPVIVDYMPGANAVIGSNYVAKADPDGYSLLVTTGGHSIKPATTNLPYDNEKDLVAVGPIGRSDIILIVHPSLPVKNVQEFVAYAKKQTKKLNYASSGIGGSLHMGSLLLSDVANLQMVHIPYKGGGPTLLAVKTHEVDFAFIAIAPAVPQIKSGGVRLLGIASEDRTDTFPDMPTIAEQGYPGFEVPSAYGLVTTAGTPVAVLDKLEGAMKAVSSKPSVKAALDKIGVKVWPVSRQKYQEWMSAQTETWMRVTKKIGYKKQ